MATPLQTHAFERGTRTLVRLSKVRNQEGLRDLVSFCILYRELYQQIDDGGDISEEIFRKIMEFVEVFVLVFSINQKIFAAMEHERVPMAVTMGISANGGIAYRMVGLDGYRGVFGSIQEQ